MALRLFRALANLLRHRKVEQDLHAEIDSYQDLLEEEQLAAGLPPVTARRAARLALGSPDDTKESVRDVRAGARIEQMIREVRFALRTLARSPGFTAFTALTFAVTTGGLTLIFSLVHAILLKPLPYPESDRLMMVLETGSRDPAGGSSISAPNYLDWQAQNTVFERMAMYEYQVANLSDGAEPEQVNLLRVTGGIFDVLRVAPLLGRGLLPSDDSSGARVVVMSHLLWQRRYGADSGLVGRSIRMNGEAWQVVGVMPPGFVFPSAARQIWMPIQLNQQDQGRSSQSFWAIARLKDGVTVDEARAELHAIGDRLAAQYPASNANRTVNVFPMSQLWVQDMAGVLRTLLAGVVLVLLIASANIASLLVARNSARRHELAARMALGGTKPRIVRQIALESVLLALLGAGLGMGLAFAGLPGLLALFPPQLRSVPFRDLSSVAIDPTVIAVVTAIAILAGLLAGLAPALTTLPAEAGEVLRHAGTRTTTGGRGRRLKTILIGVEVALAVVVLSGAGLLIRSIQRIQRVAPGLETRNVVSVALALPQSDSYGPAERKTFCSDLAAEAGSIAGVEQVSAISHVPLSGANAGRAFTVEGAPDPGPDAVPSASYGVACPGYFRTMGIPLLGRDFMANDRAGAPPVAIVNQVLARRWFPNGDAIGRRLKLGGFRSGSPWITVVGIAGDVRHFGLRDPSPAYLYLPYQQAAWPSMSVMVKSPQELAVVGPLKAALKRIVPGEPVGEPETMDQVVDRSIGHLRFPMVLFSVFAIIALALAALGTFGVASQAVVQRRRELGIRLALGAGGGQVSRMVVRQALVPVGWGLLLGIGGAMAFTRVLRGILFDIEPTDPVTLSLVALALAGAAVIASILPARRAARTDPVDVLRQE